MVFYTYFNPPPLVVTKITGESMTKQECVEDTKIENVIRRCLFNPRTPLYGDFSSIPSNVDGIQAHNLKEKYEEALNELDDVRIDSTGNLEGPSDSERDGKTGKGEKGDKVNGTDERKA